VTPWNAPFDDGRETEVYAEPNGHRRCPPWQSGGRAVQYVSEVKLFVSRTKRQHSYCLTTTLVLNY
jgi:hypothetical protein